MTRRPRFSPAVSVLEGRSLPSGFFGSPVVATPHPPAVSPAPVVAAVPGTFGGAAGWMSLHNEFVNRAKQGNAPLVFLGDSITYLWTSAGATPQTAAVRSQFIAPRGSVIWANLYAPLGAVNFGIPGDTTGNLLWRVQHGEVSSQPRVAVVEVGINDLMMGSSPAATAAGIEADVAAVRAASPSTKVLLLSILPPSGRSLNDPLLAAVNTTNSLIDNWAYWAGVPFEYIGWLVNGQIDAADHPTAAGYQAIAYAIRAPLQMLGE